MADAVSNTSPLIYLHRIGRFQLLPQVFGRVIVPTQASQELDRGRALGRDVPQLANLPWLEIRAAVTAHDYPDLGAGETGALDLARALPDSVVILDDGAARKWATRPGIPCVGTVGVLVQAKRLGHLTRVTPELDRLARLSFRMSPALRERALADSSES